MRKNIVICSDGTGDTFSEHRSNISSLIRMLELGNPKKQVVFYDQGLGTNPKLVAQAKAYRCEPGADREALIILSPPLMYQIPVLKTLVRAAGLTFGCGLRGNVRQMYFALADAYEEGDQICLFGFSRGAFTVRVLAGLLYRCGLLRGNEVRVKSPFAKAYSPVLTRDTLS